MEETDEPAIKLNSKGKPYKNNVGPSTEQLEKLAKMRARAHEVLKAKGIQTVAEKQVYKEQRDARPTRHLREKLERKEVINEILEEKKQAKAVKPIKPAAKEESDEEEEVVTVKKKKKVKRRIVYESSSDDDHFERKPERLEKNKVSSDYDIYHKLQTLNANRVLEEKLLKANINSFAYQMR
ncbi:hypothetical protein T484DRAFT_1757524 [Baffinella frigidus]|nr:hypothetical protein T484DRAFT_1757524 [Cryptophyta sp. CCMP2293]